MLYTNDNIGQEVLQDIKRGKKQPWRPKKIRSLRLADSFKRLGYEKKSMRVRFCGSSLGFLRNLETDERKLHSADFCRERLCPMCQWRRSLKIFHQVSKVMDKVEQQYKEFVPVFLTLTLRNCSDAELSSTLDDVFGGWKNIIDHRKIRKIVKGWFRALEITYDGDKVISEGRYNKRKKEYDRRGVKVGDINPNYDTFHPHIHTILLVDKSYFKGKDYMETVEWVQMWRTAMKLDYDPICDIRKVKTNKGRHKPVAEVAKYTLKDSEYIIDDNDLTDKLVRVLGGSLKGRRLFAFGGLLKKIAKEIGVEELAEGSLVNIDDEAIREDIATVLEIYRWNFGLANYIKD